MIIELKSKDAEGNLLFEGKLNREEASFVLNVGLNYLMAEGAMPHFTGEEDDEEIPLHKVHDEPTTKQ